MQERPEQETTYNPLRELTPAQFMALGGNAVVFIRPIKGEKLVKFLPADVGSDEDLQLVMSGDGSPLLVADSEAAVVEWLADKNFGVVALH
ncbi:MAG: DUF1150 family protein [Devosia sp.]